MSLRIRVHDGEPIGQAIRRFKKLVERAGVPGEMRRRAHFVDDTEIRRAKEFRKRFKAREAVLHARMAAGLTGSALDEAKTAFWKRTGKP